MTETQTIPLPSVEGEFTPEEAQALYDSQINETNLAFDEDRAEEGRKFVEGIVREASERMHPLKRRWRGTYFMLSGNTLERGGPEDVHVPKLYSQLETLIPRLESSIVGEDPWFRIVARHYTDQRQADTLAAYMDWLFDQSKVRLLIQPALRDMLITQCATFYVYWENRVCEKMERIPVEEIKDGKLKRSVKLKRKKEVVYAGPVARLVDPYDLIVDTKSTNPQNATYFGHRAFLTKDEIKRIGKQMGWANLDKLDEGQNQSFGQQEDYYAWTRDPASRYGGSNYQMQQKDGRPEKIEVVFLHSKYELNDGEYTDTRFVVSGGRICHEIRKNPNDEQFRPYATMRVTKSGHEFFGTGPFDNSVRLNQHFDLLHQTFLRGARISAVPFGFVEGDVDGEFPDSLYRLQPGKLFTGVGNIRFTSVPDGFMRSMPLVLGTLDNEINQTTGVYPINMGQDSGGTATEAVTALNEGNRRSSGPVAGFADGLEQLLDIYYRLLLQHSTKDVEFPVLGKRGLDMRRTHATVGPANLLDGVKFELIGLRSIRTAGLKATGWIQSLNALGPIVAQNPTAIDGIGIAHDVISELVGPDAANARVKVPTPVEYLYSQDEENEALVNGAEVEVDPDDEDAMHLANQTFKDLVRRALDENDEMPKHVRMNVLQHYGQHMSQKGKKDAQKAAQQSRQPMPPPEAGGDVSAETGASSPVAGGFSDAAKQTTASPGGQTPGENPGPADGGKYARPGRASRTTNQTQNEVA